MAHHQGMTLVSLANALLGDPMVKRFHADPRVQATELLLQERIPRQAPITQPRPVEETRATGGLARARGSALPVAAHPVPPCAVPLQRQLHRRGDERRRGRQLLSRPRGHPAPGGSDPRPGEPVPLPARRAERLRVVGHLSAHAEGAGGLRGHVPPGEGHLPPPRRRHRHPARHRGLHRGRRRGAAAGRDQPQRSHPRDRGHELRRDRPRPGRRRPGPPGVRQAVRGDGVPPGERRPPLPSAAARRGRARRLGGPRPHPRRADAGRRGMGDRPRALPGARARSRRPAGPRWALACPAPPASCSTPWSACASAFASRRAAS